MKYKKLLGIIFLCTTFFAKADLLSSLNDLERSLNNLAKTLAVPSKSVPPKAAGQLLHVIISVTHPLDKPKLQKVFDTLGISKVASAADSTKFGTEFLQQSSWHLTLAYIDITVDATVDKQQVNNNLTQIAQSWLTQNSFDLPFGQFELWDRFFVAAYNSDQKAQKAIDDLTQQIAKKYPNSVSLYPAFEPHISLIRLKGFGSDPETDLKATRTQLASYDKKKGAVPAITIGSGSRIKVNINN